MKRDFLRLRDLTLEEHQKLFARAHALKAARRERRLVETLRGRSLLLLFEKHSTRTRLSFEAAIGQLGGTAISLPMADSQLSRGESLQDTARVVSRYVDAIAFRTHGDDRLVELARHSSVPVINALSDGGHPVQLLADLFTLEERLGRIEGRSFAFIGDGASNMALSFVEAAGLFGFTLRLAAPKGYRPHQDVIAAAGSSLQIFDRPAEAAAGADALATDVWISMGQESEAAARRTAFAGYLVDEAILARARPGAPVLHCLPAHRGEEIAASVIDGPQSVVLDEAENRLHVQKALLEMLLLP